MVELVRAGRSPDDLAKEFEPLLDAIILVQPETVIRWHRRGFRAH
jgi:hypothetical protein